MSLRFVLVVSWACPLLLLAWVVYHEVAAPNQPVIETNSRMRVRMCLEHVDAARANPADDAAKQAVDDCILAGYISNSQAGTAVD